MARHGQPLLSEFRGAELAECDLAVSFAAAQQRAVRAAADDAPAVEHEDLVRVQDGAQALRHDDDRGVVRLLGQRLTQRGVRLIVERGKAVVKQVHLRVLGDGARDGQALPLPAGHVRPALPPA